MDERVDGYSNVRGVVYFIAGASVHTTFSVFFFICCNFEFYVYIFSIFVVSIHLHSKVVCKESFWYFSLKNKNNIFYYTIIFYHPTSKTLNKIFKPPKLYIHVTHQIKQLIHAQKRIGKRFPLKALSPINFHIYIGIFSQKCNTWLKLPRDFTCEL